MRTRRDLKWWEMVSIPISWVAAGIIVTMGFLLCWPVLFEQGSSKESD